MHYKIISALITDFNGQYTMGSEESIRKEITINPSKSTAYVGQDFDLKCQVQSIANQRPRRPRMWNSSGIGYTTWEKVDGNMSPNVRNVGGNTIRYDIALT